MAPIAVAAVVIPRWLRVLRNPLMRIVCFIALAMLFAWLARRVSGLHPLSITVAFGASTIELCWRVLVASLPIIAAYWVLVRGVEGRHVDELAVSKLLPDSARGLLVGAGLMSAAAGLMVLFGAYQIVGVNSDVDLLAPLVLAAIIPGITEELIFRGVLFRVVEDALGTWIAVAISGAFFGMVHFGNPNATLWTSFAIALEAGILLAMLYAWTRSLYFVIGVHAAWNFTQGAVFDFAVSGIDMRALLDARTQGLELLSGGEFGAEASLLTVLLCLALSVVATQRAHRRGRIRKPYWLRITPTPSDLPAGTAS